MRISTHPGTSRVKGRFLIKNGKHRWPQGREGVSLRITGSGCTDHLLTVDLLRVGRANPGRILSSGTPIAMITAALLGETCLNGSLVFVSAEAKMRIPTIVPTRAPVSLVLMTDRPSILANNVLSRVAPRGVLHN